MDKNAGVTVSWKKRGGPAEALRPQQEFNAAVQGKSHAQLFYIIKMVHEQIKLGHIMHDV